jgi:Leucine-rich repeat (LRR) protein
MINFIISHFSNNHLSALPSTLFTLPLQVLLLAGNRLETLSSELKNLGGTLQELDLHANRIRQLPAAIALLTELRVLNLHSNQLKDLPGGESFNNTSIVFTLFRAWMSTSTHS